MATPIIRDEVVFCRRCDRQLGVIGEDGQYLEAGNIRLYGFRHRYFCLCGRAYFFTEKNLGSHNTSDFPAETHEILNALGRDYLTDEETRNASKQTYRKKFKEQI
jgi:hypothetical protein